MNGKPVEGTEVAPAPKPVSSLNNLIKQLGSDVTDMDIHLNTLEIAIETMETRSNSPVNAQKDTQETHGDTILDHLEHLVGYSNNNQNRLFSLIERLQHVIGID